MHCPIVEKLQIWRCQHCGEEIKESVKHVCHDEGERNCCHTGECMVDITDRKYAGYVENYRRENLHRKFTNGTMQTDFMWYSTTRYKKLRRTDQQNFQVNKLKKHGAKREIDRTKERLLKFSGLIYHLLGTT